MPTVIPIFPLNTVVFPGQQVPLHIFEPRYRQLVADVRRDEGEFGIALIESGPEVGGGAVPRAVGCAVRIAEMQELPDGRFNVICRGTRRFRLLESLDEAPYLRGEVEFPPRPDDAGDEETAERAGDVRDLFADHLGLALAIEGGWQREMRTPADPVRLADTIGATVAAPIGHKQAMLEASRVATRLEIGQRLLESANRSLREQLALRRRLKLGGLGAQN
ncbi:MAG: LON peptidase substrate-binding domain-containing protein [Chloroflexi bacterium]|nr:LON peptidase substrate-binding domain-containing protein [Chloroflexota bacterium]